MIFLGWSVDVQNSVGYNHADVRYNSNRHTPKYCTLVIAISCVDVYEEPHHVTLSANHAEVMVAMTPTVYGGIVNI